MGRFPGKKLNTLEIDHVIGVILILNFVTHLITVLVSRQFVEMTRARIEGLLAAFPKLMNSGKQHTFVETESVRYVYQALEQLFVVLITTKASNILEDLETLRLFARVVSPHIISLTNGIMRTLMVLLV